MTENQAANNKHIANQQLHTEIRKALCEKYNLHRKLAKLAFEDDEATLIQLGLKTPIPTDHLEWTKDVKIFYTQVLASEYIKTNLNMVKVQGKDLLATHSMIVEMENA